jgi:(1->4)-alpha-D-glucan 1-alpha-D-glucosylmutase
MPEPGIGYLLAQTLAAVGLIDRARLTAYLIKAAREASVGTAWIDGDPDFEAAIEAGVDRIYDTEAIARLVTDFHRLVRPASLVNSYGQKLLQLLAPGVPDVYQGTELIDDSLVDPDNRRPVDFARRRRLLAELDSGARPGEPDAVKVLITSRALRLRRETSLPGYRPVYASGPAADHLIGFDRGPVIAIATRLPIGLSARGGWDTTSIDLPEGDWTDVLSRSGHAGRVPVRTLLGDFPVALLRRVD